MQHILELPKIDFITTVKGKPKSVILDFVDWKRIVETLKIMSSKELRKSINTAKDELHKGSKLYSIKELSNL